MGNLKSFKKQLHYKTILHYYNTYFFSIINLNAQTTDFITTGLDAPFTMVYKNNYLHVTQIASAGKISKIDITAENPVTVDIIAGNRPNGLLINGNDLYKQ